MDFIYKFLEEETICAKIGSQSETKYDVDRLKL